MAETIKIPVVYEIPWPWITKGIAVTGKFMVGKDYATLRLLHKNGNTIEDTVAYVYVEYREDKIVVGHMDYDHVRLGLDAIEHELVRMQHLVRSGA